MAYNNRNFLLRVQDVVEAYLDAKNEDISVTRVYNQVIKPSFRISRSTLYNYLNIPYKRLLKELEQKERDNNNRTLKLF